MTRILRNLTWLGILILCLGFWTLANRYAHAQVSGPPVWSMAAYKYANITTDATTVVKASPGVLHTICINTPAATETLTIYDNTAGSGTKIGTVTIYASTNPCLTYDINFATGLTIVSATAASDITVSYY